MSNENDFEIKYVFNLLDPTNTHEIHVQQVNQIVQSLENLSPERKRSKTMGAPESDNSLKLKLKPAKESEKRISVLNIPTNNPKTFQNRGFKKAATDQLQVNENSEKSIKQPEIKQTFSHEKEMNLLEIPEKEKEDIQLKHFPNRKKTMNNEEFSELYQEVFHHNGIKEDVLLKCFSIFDYEKQGFLNAKAVQKVFEVFNEKISEEDVENLLKFVGCSSGKMTFQEFQDFFKKNL